MRSPTQKEKYLKAIKEAEPIRHYIPPSVFGVARVTIEIRCKIRTDDPNLIKRVAEIQEELSHLASGGRR